MEGGYSSSFAGIRRYADRPIGITDAYTACRNAARLGVVLFGSYDDRDYGYLRLIAIAAQLTIEYHPASHGCAAKPPTIASPSI